ncbi:hypothetical protein HK097_005961 [Rhizophlyctis rosea]|uniref:Dynein heavy chain tail domain-containing protein n=1 Tax=Rhizophlyctis rosea TaxID=64517 RepID=A0AAD5SKS8_9FUNG|nr:hypothetical protein HK097_005961 [Rhizophlyctis rosea]
MADKDVADNPANAAGTLQTDTTTPSSESQTPRAGTSTSQLNTRPPTTTNPSEANLTSRDGDTHTTSNGDAAPNASNEAPTNEDSSHGPSDSGDRASDSVTTSARSLDAANESLPHSADTVGAVDLSQLLARVKSLVVLTDFDTSMWTEGYDRMLEDFLTEPGARKLFAYVSNDSAKPTFHLQPTPPAATTKQVLYLIRTTNADEPTVTIRNFERTIQYGTVSGNAMESLLRLMQGLYIPMFSENKRWPDSVRKELANQTHKFMAQLTDTTYQAKGHTVLYVPSEDLSNVEKAAKTKDLVQRLESLLVHWTRQIKEVVNNQHTSETTENSGPLEEIQFWRSRCDDLSGISDQLNSAEVRNIIQVLELAKSSYLEQFVRLSNLIQEGTIQAQDNLKFLLTLNDPCQILAQSEPKAIPPILPRLLNCVRIIWSNSTYYNTKERLTSLLRKISNEIIRRCCARISLEEIFHGDVSLSMVSLQDSISCGEAWKVIYKKTCTHVAKYSGKGVWDFDQSSIFAQIDAFVQRCRDLLEVCEGQIQFARKINGGERAPVPFFGGSKGLEIAKR